MGFEIDKIFLPSVGVNLVFDMDSLTPVSRSSIIYDTSYGDKTITIAQPIVPVTSETRFDQLHLTTIVHFKQRRARVGLACKPVKFIDQYQLANNSVTKALVIQYKEPPIETNIRAAFRLPLSQRHNIKAKLLFNGVEYFTARDFKIKDISFAGMGLVVPKKFGKKTNPLTEVKLTTPVPVGMILVDKNEKDPVGTFPVKTKVVRLNPNYSESHMLVGLRITAIMPESEDLLNRFIHKAQIDELKRISKRG
ncbi:MAG TPA: hypothetical protein DHV36_04300 [Desulfobacteraceae bacterium]|nr:hypothetical protein [Desulfobacteraceae bacterium]